MILYQSEWLLGLSKWEVAEKFYDKNSNWFIIDGSRNIYCFVSAPPKISVTQIVKYLKGISGNTLLKEFPELRESLWKGQLWNGSYFCESIGSTSEENILKYIERQKNCQL